MGYKGCGLMEEKKEEQSNIHVNNGKQQTIMRES